MLPSHAGNCEHVVPKNQPRHTLEPTYDRKRLQPTPKASWPDPNASKRPEAAPSNRTKNSCPTTDLCSQDGAPQRTRNATHAMHAGRRGRNCQTCSVRTSRVPIQDRMFVLRGPVMTSGEQLSKHTCPAQEQFCFQLHWTHRPVRLSDCRFGAFQ